MPNQRFSAFIRSIGSRWGIPGAPPPFEGRASGLKRTYSEPRRPAIAGGCLALCTGITRELALPRQISGRGKRPLLSPRRKRVVERALAGSAFFDRGRGSRRRAPHLVLLRNQPDRRHSVKTELSRIYRFARRGVHATLQEVLTRAIAASQHWRIIRGGAAQHF
jgi:hypothetical protein